MFEGSQGTVPNHCAAVLQSGLEGCHALGTDIEDQVFRRDLVNGDFPCFFALFQTPGNHGIHRQQHSDAPLVGLGEQAGGGLEMVILHQRLAHGTALSLQKGIGHGPADDEAVSLVDEVFQELDFGRDLRPTDDHGERAPGILHGFAEILHLFLQLVAGSTNFQVPGNAVYRSVRPMRYGKRVVDVDLRQLSQLSGKTIIVLFFLGMEPQIFQQQQVSGLHGRDPVEYGRSDTIRCHRHRPIKKPT